MRGSWRIRLVVVGEDAVEVMQRIVAAIDLPASFQE